MGSMGQASEMPAHDINSKLPSAALLPASFVPSLDRATFLVSSTFHQRRIESSSERSITASSASSVRPLAHFIVGWLGRTRGRESRLQRKRGKTAVTHPLIMTVLAIHTAQGLCNRSGRAKDGIFISPRVLPCKTAYFFITIALGSLFSLIPKNNLNDNIEIEAPLDDPTRPMRNGARGQSVRRRRRRNPFPLTL